MAWQSLKFGAEMLQAGNGHARGLLVCFRGAGGDRQDKLRSLCERIAEDLTDVDILLIGNFREGIFSFKSPVATTCEALQAVNEYASDHYEEVRFLAYSLGASIARKVLVAAQKNAVITPMLEDELRNETAASGWLKKVKRVVFISGYARGWVNNPRTNFYYKIIFNFWGALGRVLARFSGPEEKGVKTPTLFALRRGSPFIFNSRMQWNAAWQMPASLLRRWEIVHLIPTDDRLISSVEVLDVESSLGATARSKVRYYEIPQSDHSTILDVVGKPTLWRRLAAWGRGKPHMTKDERLKTINPAICGRVAGTRRSPFHGPALDDSALKALRMPQAYLDDQVPPHAMKKVQHYIFIIHGIRDTGAWAKKIGGVIRKQVKPDGSENTVVTDTQTYGYFTALPFLLSWVRRAKVEWLMDRYATARALYPNAQISYFGHSNGTYLAAYAVREYSCCRFERVVFAGSVVASNFKWSKFLDREESGKRQKRKVGKVLNYIASHDGVVAFGPRNLGRLLHDDLGGAGTDGFPATPGLQNSHFAPGGHSAALDEKFWPEQARFLLHGTFPPAGSPADPLLVHRQSRLFKFLVRISPLGLLLLAALTIWLFKMAYGEIWQVLIAGDQQEALKNHEWLNLWRVAKAAGLTYAYYYVLFKL